MYPSSTLNNNFTNDSLCTDLNNQNLFPTQLLNTRFNILPVNLYKENYGDTLENNVSDLEKNSNYSQSITKRKIFYRNSVILSSTKDKDTLDGEIVSTPQRSIDRIEKFIANKSLIQNDLSNKLESISSPLSSLSKRSIDNADYDNNIDNDRCLITNNSKFKKFMPIFMNDRYYNIFNTWKEPSALDLFRFFITPSNLSLPSEKKELDLRLPVLKPIINRKLPKNTLRTSWLGHSTVLVQFNNFSLITDPIFSDFANPIKYRFFKRYRPVPININELPKNLKAVFISHNHYDHLDYESVVELNEKYSNSLTWFVPKGLYSWFNDINIKNVVELNWWQEYCFLDSKITFVPAQHWSRRKLCDKNKSLWGGWIVSNNKFKFYFAGDTGYNEKIFRMIGDNFGPFDLSAIPIGAYEPNWFLKYQHVNPKEAVQIHNDIKSKLSMAIHWGTFPLSKEHYLSPPQELGEALDYLNIPEDKFVVFQHGETRLIKKDGISKKEN